MDGLGRGGLGGRDDHVIHIGNPDDVISSLRADSTLARATDLTVQSASATEDSTGLESAVVESAQRTYITLDLSPSAKPVGQPNAQAVRMTIRQVW
jgi:hypothetical protein